MRMHKFTVVLLMLCMAGPAHSAFRYLDPLPVTATAAPVPAGKHHTASDQAATAESPDSPHWDARNGELLQDTLKRWGARVGIEVHVLTDRHYRLDASRRFVGTFGDVVAALLDSLSWLPYPPAAEMTPQDVLLIRHRVPQISDDRGGAPRSSPGQPAPPK